MVKLVTSSTLRIFLWPEPELQHCNSGTRHLPSGGYETCPKQVWRDPEKLTTR